MGWRSIHKNGEIRTEGLESPLGDRPVAQGEEGNLVCIEQSDFGHRVSVDLIHGIIFIDHENEVTVQNGTIEISNPKATLFLCEETNIVAEYKHVQTTFDWAKDEFGKKLRREDGQGYKVRTDHLSDLTFRPIWFTRYTNGMPTKVIGVQTTTPEIQGAKNIKLMVSLFIDGKIGISA